MVRLALKSLASVRFTRPEFMSSWWDEINESTQWQDGIFLALCAAYAVVSAVALVLSSFSSLCFCICPFAFQFFLKIQLIRIELRVPQYGWTTQKVFHFMNFIVNGVRAVVFGFRMYVFALKPKVLTLVVLELPGLLFFTTYTLLVLFWAEIYFQARSLSTDKLRPVYLTVNCIIYAMQFCIWVVLWLNDNSFVESLGQIFIAVVSFIAALGFLLYGGRLFFMLRRFPIESKGRRKKLREVLISAFDLDASLEVFDHPVLDLIYYLLVEVLPSALVLFILRKLPPKRVSAQYHQIR
ncbi:hypothetical protein Cgig2_029623 [Carnegiea gigantea]|uniref:THH1/TOM1/TOM3 domain-containing protein n=1 Tax=Carnegiea gigantea TaxID=171969 RepID=A0A9Q1KJ10_9CARY|nr:hypothetical protein Cgig2_029623 [Carnegiea gigantea]